VSESFGDVAFRDQTLDELLTGCPEAIVAALTADGFRVPMPAGVGLPDHQAVRVPADQAAGAADAPLATMADLVVPADCPAVVTAWERAQRTGLAFGKVRTRHAPNRQLTLTFVDARHRYGVWLGALSESAGHRPPATPDARAGRDGAAKVMSNGANAPKVPVQPAPHRPRTASMVKDQQAIITGIDDRATRMLGWTEEQMVGHRSVEFLHPDDHGRALASWLELTSQRRTQRVRLRHRCRDGSWLWVEVENRYHPPEDPASTVITTQLTDVSDEMAARDAMDRRDRLFRRLAESLPIGLLQLEPDGSVVYANARLARLLGAAGTGSLGELLAGVVEQDRPALRAALHRALRPPPRRDGGAPIHDPGTPCAATNSAGVDEELEIAVRLPGSHELRRCQVTLIAVADEDGGQGVLACVNDITESARMREELRIRATFDVLTGCYNRAAVISALDQALASENGRPTAVIFVDLNEFKSVNDTLGHAAGDELLVHAADRLNRLIRDEGIVGRIGGDEFLLVCRGLDGPEQALAIAHRVHRALRQQVPLSAGTVELGASVGVACSAPGTASDTLIAHADAAMYESKRRGNGRPVLYRPARRAAS
jgi:diguanylate cyclase (GGDEF)-like protein/PAS domain S-box-containing protein